MLGPVYGLGSGLGGSYQKIQALPVQTNTLTYNGKSQNAVWSYDSSQVIVTEDSGSQVHAGSYEVKFKPVKPYCWPDGTQSEKSFFWTIQPVAISDPVLTASTITYNGKAQSPDITYDLKISENGDTLESVFETEHISEKIAKSYIASWTIKNSDYVWITPSPAKKTASWTIYKKSVTVPSVSDINKTYNATVQGPSITPVTSSDWTKTSYEGTDAGNYTLTVSLVDPDNTVWSGKTDSKPLTFPWSIKTLEITKPVGTPLNFTYNAEKQGPDISNGPSTTYVKRTGSLTATDAGTYDIVYSFVCNTNSITNACWKEDKSTSNVTVSYTINKLRIPVPTASLTSVEYSKTTYNPGFSDLSAYSKYFTVDGVQQAADVGTYPVTYSIKNTYNSTVQNVTWDDNTVDEKTVIWEIVTRRLTKPTLSSYSFNFTPSGITISDYERNVDASYVTRLSNSSSSLTGYDVGDYSTGYELSCNKAGIVNTTWSDGSTDPVILSWQILKLTLIKPVQSGTLIYDMTEKTAIWNSNYSSDYMTVTGNKGINATTYTATFTTKYPGNAQFGSSDTAQASWIIKPRTVMKPSLLQLSYTYNKALQTPTIQDLDSSYVTTSGNLNGTNANDNYNITCRLSKNTGSVINTTWNDGTTDNVILNWKIAKAKLPAITLSETRINLTSSVTSKVITVTREGNGQIIVDNPGTSVLTANVSEDKVTVTVKSEVETTVNLTVRVAEGSNYFASTTATEKTITVIMSDFATKLAVKSTDIVQSNYLSYTNSTLTAEFTGYDPETMSITGNTGKAAKDYTATIVCKTGYVFKDGVNSVQVPWTIHSYLVDIPYLYKSDTITLTSQYCNEKQLTTDEHKFGTGSFHCDGNIKHQLVISGIKSTTNGSCFNITFWLKAVGGKYEPVEYDDGAKDYRILMNICNRLIITQTGAIFSNMGKYSMHSASDNSTWAFYNASIDGRSYTGFRNSSYIPGNYWSYYNIRYVPQHYYSNSNVFYIYINGRLLSEFYHETVSLYGSNFTDNITINNSNCDAYIDDFSIKRFGNKNDMITTEMPTTAAARDSHTQLIMNFDT